MKYSRLGRTDLQVSRICLGTMTWGKRNTEAEGHAQMDYAVDQGINFFDTAEMYAVPPTAETYGTTESIIGTWFEKTGKRPDIVLATKIVGPNPRMDWARGGKTQLDAMNLRQAVDDSLKRLKTDYIDLYQTHWPNRGVNIFGRLGYTHNPDERFLDPAETLDAMAEVVKAGKVRYFGLSNETPWGVMRHVAAADEDSSRPRVVSIQNPYSLLNRTFEIGLAEIAMREQVGLLAYSPMAGGTLSGKYLDGALPEGSRRALDGRGSRYDNPQAEAATKRYAAIAREAGLDPGQMALAYVNTREFLTANIIGATSMEQLKTDIASIDLDLPDSVVEAIEAVHVDHPNPGP